jgi:hypothetical protein
MRNKIIGSEYVTYAYMSVIDHHNGTLDEIPKGFHHIITSSRKDEDVSHPF